MFVGICSVQVQVTKITHTGDNGGLAYRLAFADHNTDAMHFKLYQDCVKSFVLYLNIAPHVPRLDMLTSQLATLLRPLSDTAFLTFSMPSCGTML